MLPVHWLMAKDQSDPKSLDQSSHAAEARALDLDLPLHLDRASLLPLSRQLVRELRRAIEEGWLPPGTRLPPTRTLARAFGLSRHTVLNAYDELLSEGLLRGQVGSGTFVNEIVRLSASPDSLVPTSAPRWLRGEHIAAQISPPSTAAQIDFRAGQPEVAPLSNEAWRRAWRRVASEALPGEYAAAAGDPELRAQIAAYLTRSRSLPCTAQDILITSGTIQGLHLVARATLAVGDTVAFEEPGYRLARQVFQERGAVMLPVAVDGDGVRVSDLPETGTLPTLVYTTPSHQFPLGSRLSLPRRAALIAWAREHDALLIEDDYDGEFRYDAPPLPALASLDPARVVYLGTFSKVLSPALRVGYLVAPPALRGLVTELKSLTDYHTSWPVQRALVHFMASGDLDRHLQRMRRTYARKRAVLVRALSGLRGLARVRGLDAGFHVYLELDSALDAQEVADRAAQRGVVVSPLTPFYVGPAQVNALLLGYGGLSLEQIDTGGRILAEMLREMKDLKQSAESWRIG